LAGERRGSAGSGPLGGGEVGRLACVCELELELGLSGVVGRVVERQGEREDKVGVGREERRTEERCARSALLGTKAVTMRGIACCDVSSEAHTGDVEGWREEVHGEEEGARLRPWPAPILALEARSMAGCRMRTGAADAVVAPSILLSPAPSEATVSATCS
jgi:hypothetical protein